MPEITDYEVWRELLRAKKPASVLVLHAVGYFAKIENRAHCQTDKDFEALRQCEEFQKFVAAVEKMQP